jgi:hypothetical protein
LASESCVGTSCKVAEVVDDLPEQRGPAMAKTTTRLLSGVAVAVLAAAGVAAVMRHRQGQKPNPDERAHLDELEARLSEVEEPGTSTPLTAVGRVVQNLQRNRGISVAQLRLWITGLRHGSLSHDQATVAESDFEALEREADQGGV